MIELHNRARSLSKTLCLYIAIPEISQIFAGHLALTAAHDRNFKFVVQSRCLYETYSNCEVRNAFPNKLIYDPKVGSGKSLQKKKAEEVKKKLYSRPKAN